jgi:heme/copper-type cytochrome/quinol oxidase subunit 2
VTIVRAIVTAFKGAQALWIGIGIGFLVAMPTVMAEDQPAPVEVTIKDHRFSPSEIHVQAGKPTFLEVTNQDAAAEEFEIRQLAIEKLILGGAKGKIRLRPLGPGRYLFIGEFHEDTAQGAIVAE